MLANERHLLTWLARVALILGVVWVFSLSTVYAQQGVSRIVISSSDIGSAPAIILRAFGVDERGGPLDLTAKTIVINHDGLVVDDVQVIGDYQAGTFTVFVVDIPGGLEGQLPAIQEAIEQFSSPPNMQEPVDYIAIYRVGEDNVGQLLSPTNFYNAIRNFFDTPLEPAPGQTALADSVGNLLQDVNSLNPKGDMATSIVLITDGTDAVSTEFQLEDLAIEANRFGLPIHTIWVPNDQLLAANQEEGRRYLANLATVTGGVATQLSDPDGLLSIWERITSFRMHHVIQYRPENISGGQIEVNLSLSGDPEVQDSTEIFIPLSAPTIEIILPQESRQISLDTLEEPVRLSLSTVVQWLDGVDRDLVSAELLVNQIPVQQIEVEELDRFTADVSYFAYGPNDIQVRIVDESDQTATSPPLTLMVVEGETSLPEEMQPGSIWDSSLIRAGIGCLVVLVALAFVAGAITVLRKSGIRGRIPSRRSPRPDSRQVDSGKRPSSTDVDSQLSSASNVVSSAAQPGTKSDQASGSRPPYLEILASVTRMAPMIDLTAVEHRIGRSPVQADIVFENDITVSRLHASIVLEGSDYRIYDEGSTSGTWVNGQRVSDYGHQLLDGDEIRLGDTWMRYIR